MRIIKEVNKLALMVDDTNINYNTGTSIKYVGLNSTAKNLLTDKLSENKLKEFIKKSFANDEEALCSNNSVDLKEHLKTKEKLFYKIIESAKTIKEMNGAFMSINGFEPEANCKININVLDSLLECVANNKNVLSIMYFDSKKEFWIIVIDNSYEKYKSIIKSCSTFQEIYSEYEYLVLRKEQINFDEVSKADIELKMDVNG